MSSYLQALTWLRPRPPTPMRPTLSLPLGDLERVIAGKPRIADDAAVVLMNFRRENRAGTGWSFMAYVLQLIRYKGRKTSTEATNRVGRMTNNRSRISGGDWPQACTGQAYLAILFLGNHHEGSTPFLAMESMCGVDTSLQLYTPTSSHPRSSARMTTMLGCAAASDTGRNTAQKRMAFITENYLRSSTQMLR